MAPRPAVAYLTEKVEGELWDQAKHGKWGPKIIYLVTSGAVISH